MSENKFGHWQSVSHLFLARTESLKNYILQSLIDSAIDRKGRILTFLQIWNFPFQST